MHHIKVGNEYYGSLGRLTSVIGGGKLIGASTRAPPLPGVSLESRGGLLSFEARLPLTRSGYHRSLTGTAGGG